MREAARPFTTPDVSFIVPCYKLAHVLPDCIHSILAQTYANFEVLIMDDCSPDDTVKVATSFGDPRVKHIRNPSNLGHLQNYNKGIGLSRAKYVWLISADDCLRRRHALERYVQLMEAHPGVGYVFCPAVRLENGHETELLGYSVHGTRDAIFLGRRFLGKLINENTIVAASGMVRRECYERLGAFPLDAPWGGDWYLWCLFALYYDVGYCAEPMVNYRRHELTMTDTLIQERVRACAEEDIELSWRIRGKVEEAGDRALVRKCNRAIAHQYATSLASKRYRSSKGWHEYSMTVSEFEESLRRHAKNRQETNFIRARVYADMADQHYWKREFDSALRFYGLALRHGWWIPKVWAKYLLLRTGGGGLRFRKA